MVLENHPQALEALKELLPLVQASADRQWEGMILGDIGFAYFEAGQKEKAFEYLRNRLEYERKQQNEVGEAETDKALGWAYQSIGEKKKAVRFYQQALALRLKFSRTVVSDELKAEIAELREVIKKLQE
jgi:tetratricopeptide (TPR) repeat protein